jgi:hypothetical protein
MKTASERIKARLKKDRQMTVISMRIPEDVIEDLKEIAPSLGFSGYQPLIRAYIGQGLRRDQARMENSQLQALTESLRKRGIADGVISAAIAEAQVAGAEGWSDGSASEIPFECRRDSEDFVAKCFGGVACRAHRDCDPDGSGNCWDGRWASPADWFWDIQRGCIRIGRDYRARNAIRSSA